MGAISFRGVASGLAVSLLLLGAVSAYLNFVSSSANALVYALSLVSWILPGYVAGATARERGTLNGAVVGILVGILAGALASWFRDPPDRIDSLSGLEVGLVVGTLGALLCGLGGLTWDLVQGPNKR